MQRLFRMLTVCAALAATTTVEAQAPQSSTPRPAAAGQEYLFPSGAGMLFFHVRPDRAQDFESVLTRLADALDSTIDPVRKQQASSWKMFRSAETPREQVIYVFLFDPAVAGADYDPVKVLSEAAPADVQGLYERLRDGVVRVERMGLAKLR